MFAVSTVPEHARTPASTPLPGRFTPSNDPHDFLKTPFSILSPCRQRRLLEPAVLLARRRPTRQSSGPARKAAQAAHFYVRRLCVCAKAPRAMNRWNIPPWLEREVIARDRRCVYCGVEFVVPTLTRGCAPSWEHIVNDARMVTRENIARCCISCNASKGTKDLVTWLRSNYCQTRGIAANSVAAVVRATLTRHGGSDVPGA